MRRILMYLILAGSITVFAQLQLQDMETTAGASGDAPGLTEQAENEPGDKVTPAQGQSDSAAAEPDASSTSAKQPVSTDDEYASKVEHQGENEETDEAGDYQPSDEDFKPAEEISEDYPVPLPSDI